MCNRYGYLAPISRLIDEFSQIRIPIVFKDGAVPNLEPREHIRPTNIARIIRPLDPSDPFVGVELVDARWWLIPFFHKKGVKDWKPMCTNARAETVATTATFREAFKPPPVPCAGHAFLRMDRRAGAKAMWRFSKAGADIFCFPGLWDVAETTDGRIESFTIVTTSPGPDCAPYHNRQPVVLGTQAVNYGAVRHFRSVGTQPRRGHPPVCRGPWAVGPCA